MLPTKLYRSPKSQPNRLLAWVMGLLLGLSLVASEATQLRTAEREDQSLAKAIGAFSKEQALAEDYVGLMKTIGQTRFQDYADGIRLYATARAEFNSLIEQLKHELIQHAPPQGSEAFKAALNSAVNHRMAFTVHVDEMVRAYTGDGHELRPGVSDYIKGAGELLKIFVDAGNTVWEAYSKVSESKRRETIEQLESLKWKPFAQLAGTP